MAHRREGLEQVGLEDESRSHITYPIIAIWLFFPRVQISLLPGALSDATRLFSPPKRRSEIPSSRRKISVPTLVH